MIRIKFKNKSILDEDKIKILDKVKQNFDQYKDYYWVFFDTETTGTESETEQITEFAAIAVDADFLNTSEPLIHDTLHKKVFLRDDMEITDTKGPGGTLSRADVASLTRAGAPKDPKKAARKNVKPFKKEDFVDEKQLCVLIDNFMKNLQTQKNVVLLAHNAKFDLKFVNKAFARNGMGDFNYPTIDTMNLASDYFIPLLRLAQDEEVVKVYDKLFSMTDVKIIMRGSLSKRLGHLADVLDIDTKEWHSAIADVKMLMGVTKVIFNHLEKYGKYELEVKPDKKRK